MGIYSVIIVGTGIKIPAIPEPIIGFFTTRIVNADSAEEAISMATKSVQDDWRKSDYKNQNLGTDPTLELETVKKIGVITAIRNRNIRKGYTFFS